MYQPIITNEIWNRACKAGVPASTPGDSALESMIVFHSVAMNGSVLHAIEHFTSEKLEKVKDGYRYFGIGSVPDLISFAQASIHEGEDLEALEEELDDRYSAEIPDDTTLVQAFEVHYQRSPERYALVEQ
jgi:hypothetical protein